MTGRREAMLHLGLALAWASSIPAAFVFGWWESLAFVAFASIYANMATHWGAYQSSKVERKMEDDD